MKAIAPSIEPKAVESGLNARADRPVAGFDFDHLFAMIGVTAPTEEGVVAAQLAEFPAAVGQDGPIAGLTPLETDGAQPAPAPVPSAAAVQIIDAGLGHPGLAAPIVEVGAVPPVEPQQSRAGLPFAWRDAPWVVATTDLAADSAVAPAAFGPSLAVPVAPQAEPLVVAPLAVPGMADRVVGQDGRADPAQTALVPDVGLQDGMSLAALASVPHAHATPMAPPPLAGALAGQPQPGMPQAALLRVVEADASSLHQRPAAPLPVAAVELLEPHPDAADPIARHPSRPVEASLRAAIPHPVLTEEAVPTEDAASEPEIKIAPPPPREGAVGKSTSLPEPKMQHVAPAEATVKEQSPLAPAPAVPGPKRADKVMPGVALPGIKALAREAAAPTKTDRAPGAEAALQPETAKSIPAPKISERAEPVSVAATATRAPIPAQAAAPVLPAAVPSAAVLNLRHADWGKQLVSQVERMVANGSQRIEMSLRPKNLGEIQVLIDLRGEQTMVQIVTETAAAARLLGGAEDRLAQMLDQSGYRLSGFSAQEQGSGAQAGPQGQQGQQGQSSPRRNRVAGDAAKQEDASEAPATGPYSAGRGQSAGINMLA